MDEGTKENLEPLPESNTNFWEHAETHTNIVPEPVVKDNVHIFVRKSGREVQCTHCDWGFALDPGDYVLDGHVYDKNDNLVI
jgi:hypothetical protein